MIPATLGATGFALLTWGSVVLVIAAFVYLAVVLLSDRSKRDRTRSDAGDRR